MYLYNFPYKIAKVKKNKKNKKKKKIMTSCYWFLSLNLHMLDSSLKEIDTFEVTN